jgi:hypothetical protein
MFKVAGFIILTVFIAALFVYYRYSSLKAIESKSAFIPFALYLHIGIQLFIVLLGLDLLWEGRLTGFWTILGLMYILFSLIISTFLMSKLRALKKAKKDQQM